VAAGLRDVGVVGDHIVLLDLLGVAAAWSLLRRERLALCEVSKERLSSTKQPRHGAAPHNRALNRKEPRSARRQLAAHDTLPDPMVLQLGDQRERTGLTDVRHHRHASPAHRA
jgi:hypothetical protein